MGLDVELKVRTHEPLTDAQLAEIDAAFIEEFGREFPGRRPPADQGRVRGRGPDHRTLHMRPLLRQGV